MAPGRTLGGSPGRRRRGRADGGEERLAAIRIHLAQLRAAGSPPPPLRRAPRRLEPLPGSPGLPHAQRPAHQQQSPRADGRSGTVPAHSSTGLRGRRRVTPPPLDASTVGARQQKAGEHQGAQVTMAAAGQLASKDPSGGDDKLSKKELQFPFTQEKFEQIKHAFNELDTDGGGDLTLSEVNKIPELLGWKDLAIDRRMFRAMDKDRSGTVSFMEMLRCLYPTTKPTVLQQAAKLWGEPESRKRRDKRRQEQAAQEQDWRDELNRENWDEIKAIYNLYAVGLPQNPDQYGLDGPITYGITRGSLGQHRGLHGLHVTSIADNILDDTFHEASLERLKIPGVDPAQISDEDCYISEDAFADIMKDFYQETRSHKESQIGPLCFQDKHHPTVPYTLPRDPVAAR